MWSHKGWTAGNLHFPWPAGYTLSTAACLHCSDSYWTCPLGFPDAFLKLPWPITPSPVPLQLLHPRCKSFHCLFWTSWGFCQPLSTACWGPSDWQPCSQPLPPAPPEFGGIQNLDQGLSHPITQVVNENSKEYRPQYQSLKNATSNHPPCGLQTTDHYFFKPSSPGSFLPTMQSFLQSISFQFVYNGIMETVPRTMLKSR